MPAETAGTKLGSAVWMWLVMRMEDGLDWHDAHLGSRKIIVGEELGRGLITEAGTILSVLGVQLNLCAFRSAWEFPACLCKHMIR